MAGPRILLIDEHGEDRELASVVITRELEGVAIVEVASATEFTKAMGGAAFDLVITEYELSWSDGPAIFETVRERRPDTPVMIFTNVDDTEKAVEGMRQGLADYLVKSSRGYLRVGAAAVRALARADQQRLVARSEPWLQTLLDRANVGVFRSTPDQRLIEANPALLRLLGVESLREALDVELPTRFFQSEGALEVYREAGDRGELQSGIVELERPDGTRVWLDVTEVLLLDVDGDIVVDVLVHDIGHVKESEHALGRRVEALERSNADLESFASMASHELQEPLRTVEKFAGLLGEDLPQDVSTEARKSVDFIQDGSRRMRILVDDLLRYSRLDAAGRRFAVCDCNSIVDEIVRDLAGSIAEQGAEVHREDLPTLVADPSDLQQVFTNLLANALKFRTEESPQIEISARSGEDEWIFSVSDNGIGVDPQYARDIFRVFKRLHPEYAGTGIGLAICRRIIERQGGRIWVESESGRGAKFLFSVPIRAETSDTRPLAARNRLFTAGLLRQYHDRTPTSPLASPVVGSLLFAIVFVLLLVAAREWRKGAVAGRGVRLGSLTPLLLMLLVEKWFSITVFPTLFSNFTAGQEPTRMLDAQYRAFAGLGLIAVCLLVGAFSRPARRKTWRRCFAEN